MNLNKEQDFSSSLQNFLSIEKNLLFRTESVLIVFKEARSKKKNLLK